jgi:hypothetical protein
MDKISIMVGDMHNTSIKDLIDKWPSRAALAADLEAVIGDPVSVDRVHKWAQADSIPSGFQAHVISAGKQRGIDLTAEEMVRLHAIRSKADSATVATTQGHP